MMTKKVFGGLRGTTGQEVRDVPDDDLTANQSATIGIAAPPGVSMVPVSFKVTVLQVNFVEYPYMTSRRTKVRLLLLLRLRL